MTHAEQYSTSEPDASHKVRTRSRKRIGGLVALTIATGISSLVVVPTRPASADPISDARAQASALTARIANEQNQILMLTSQYDAASYKESELNATIAQGRGQMAKDQATVDKKEGQLKTQAIVDYMSVGTSNQLTRMFSANHNAANIHNEYSNIASGNVANIVDQLNAAKSQLHIEQVALSQQQSEVTATATAANRARTQATTLAAQNSSALDGVNANIKAMVIQQQAAAAAAAKAAAEAKIAAAQVAQAAAQAAAARTAAAQANQAAQAAAQAGAKQVAQAANQTAANQAAANQAAANQAAANQTAQAAAAQAGAGQATSQTTQPAPQASAGTGGAGSGAPSYSPPPPTSSGAAGAVQAAQSQLGVEYTWGGTSPSTGFDCSGLIMWAYAQVGISLPHYSGAQYDDTTHIPLADIEPGDILFYGPGGDEHEAMYIGGGEMVEAPYTGATVHDTPIRTGAGFAGVGRVG